MFGIANYAPILICLKGAVLFSALRLTMFYMVNIAWMLGNAIFKNGQEGQTLEFTWGHGVLWVPLGWSTFFTLCFLT